MQEEIWKDVKGWEGYYQVSSKGRVKSLDRLVETKNGHTQKKTGKLLKLSINYKGYLFVSLIRQDLREFKFVHRLVAENFIKNKNSKPQVNHKDGDKANNNIKNLEWCTNKENATHAFKSGLRSSPMKGKFGYDHNRSKAVVMKSIDGVVIREFGSAAEAARCVGVRKCNISLACTGKQKTSKGYVWEYK